MNATSLKRRLSRRCRGKNLACWCAPGAHADVLLELANR